jgi:hypothetical protein
MSDESSHASATAAESDEPKTPLWLPALGAAIFVAVGLWWAVTPSPPPPGVAPDAAASGASTASAASIASAAPKAPPVLSLAPAPPAPPGGNAGDAMQRLIDRLPKGAATAPSGGTAAGPTQGH